MQQRLLIIGDIEEEHYFSKVCQKIFSSTPIFMKSANEELDVLLNLQQSDVVFIRIDKNYPYYYELSIRLKTEYPILHVIWIAQNGQYAVPAFENNMDGYFELPVTEAKIGAVKKRLTW